jgi:hypothetical protein
MLNAQLRDSYAKEYYAAIAQLNLEVQSLFATPWLTACHAITTKSSQRPTAFVK